LSDEEVNKIYLEARADLIAGYQQGDNADADAYSEWRPVSTIPAAPGVHAKRYMMTYVNDIGYDEYVRYASQGVNMPVGSIVAKESFKIKGKSKKFSPGPIFFMEKVGIEKAPKTDGWFYSRVKANGKPMKSSQKFCHSCHEAYSGQDALGYPVKRAWVGYVEPAADAPVAKLEVGDVEAGKQAFQQCVGCHQVGEGAKNAFGPQLTNIVGRSAGSSKGYSYGSSLKSAAKGGLVWDKQNLFEWLEGPAEFLQEVLDDSSASSKMPVFVDDPKVRSDIIAYLSSMSDNGK